MKFNNISNSVNLKSSMEFVNKIICEFSIRIFWLLLKFDLESDFNWERTLMVL